MRRGGGGFRRVWVYRPDDYIMLMSPHRVAPGSRQLSMTARVIWLCACVLARLWVGVRMPIAVAVCHIRLLNSHLKCFLSATKIARFFSVRYPTKRLPRAQATKQESQTHLNSTCIYTCKTYNKLFDTYITALCSYSQSVSTQVYF